MVKTARLLPVSIRVARIRIDYPRAPRLYNDKGRASPAAPLFTKYEYLGGGFIDICVLSGLVHLNVQCVDFSFRSEIMTLSVQNQVPFGI